MSEESFENASTAEATCTSGEIVEGILVLDKVSKIKVPDVIPEKYDISGFVFSKKFLKESKLPELKVPKTDSQWKTFIKEHAKLAQKIELDSDGGPTVGENWIKIWVDTEHPNAGSTADYIWMYFGRSHRIKLWGVDNTSFPQGWWLLWDLNQVSDFLETIPTDRWDNIHLVSDDNDGIKIKRVKIVHSDVRILNWECNKWLDNSKMEAHGKMGLAYKILTKKLSYVGNTWVPQLYWAARELGKTDGTKYGPETYWCSEFASWCLRKALWDTPTGNYVGSGQMEDYFDDLGRMYTHDQVIEHEYVLNPGDYLRLLNGQHSGLFVNYIDSSDDPNDDTRIMTIEGNTGKTVKIRTRRLVHLTSVGNTR